MKKIYFLIFGMLQLNYSSNGQSGNKPITFGVGYSEDFPNLAQFKSIVDNWMISLQQLVCPKTGFHPAMSFLTFWTVPLDLSISFMTFLTGYFTHLDPPISL